ncbi:MAG TPA: hypothetical protein VD907_06105 [Verrucomicrobiae bacterium]|nr:hypothetical protein [Verrucomicrobiae bacterium]
MALDIQTDTSQAMLLVFGQSAYGAVAVIYQHSPNEVVTYRTAFEFLNTIGERGGIDSIPLEEHEIIKLQPRILQLLIDKLASNVSFKDTITELSRLVKTSSTKDDSQSAAVTNSGRARNRDACPALNKWPYGKS